MATLRLFASLREIAGTNRLEVDASSVGDALDLAISQFGERFEAGLGTAQVWVNGDQAQRDTPVTGGDEIALIPPVSGGTTTIDESADLTAAVLAGTLWVTVLLANLISTEALAFAAVGSAIAWLWDVSDTYAMRRPAVQVIPAMAGATAGATAAYRFGEAGLAAGLGLAVMFALAWAVFDKRNRGVEALSLTTVISAIAALGAGALVLIRLDSAAKVTAFLVIAGLAAVGSWAGRRFGGASVDPNLAMALVVIAAGIVIGALAESLEILVMVLAAALAAGGVIAGRTLGSMVRNGDVLHTVRAPGILTMLDPAIVGAALWWAGLLLFSSLGN
ncbi:MAG: hypothetical protein HKN91_16635 [Acidimicrobiia bacterium]|nr:hypothetical protein [Acidimicrobiia bacterium]